jgi:ABC-type branched-subunit amino acid transport system ATPase component/branched-subunit amino acid ABC-type transport system permease component
MFSDLLPFIVIGATTGAIFGLAATGLVVTYRTTGIFNFGYGALATAAAYVYYWLNVEHGIRWEIAGAIAVLGVGIVLGLVMEVISRGLAHQPTVWKVVGTIGLVLLVQGLGTIKFGVLPLQVPKYFDATTFKLGGAFVGYDQMIVVGISLFGAALLYLFLRGTRRGLAMRALVDDPVLLDLQGTSPTRVRRQASIIGSIFAALSGVLIVPFTGLEPIALTLLVVQAFGAAAIGWFASIPATYIGGVVVGIIQSVATKYAIDHTSLTGLPDGIPFIVLFLVLLLIPRRRLIPPSTVIKRPKLDYKAPGIFRLATFVIVFALLALVPSTVGLKLPFWTNGVAEAIILLSLGLLVRTARLVSLGTTAFAAIAAVAFSQFVLNFHIPWLLALVLGAAVTLPVGALLAIPAIRLHGVFLALATLGAGIMIERFVYPQGWMFTITQHGQPMPRPSWADGDKSYYYLALGILLACCLLVSGIQRGRLGRMLRALGEAPVAVGTLGLTANMTRVIVFCIAAFLAGIGGIVHGSAIHFAIANDPLYTTFQSLILLALLAISPFREPWFALIGGFGAAVIPGYLTQANTTYWMNVVFGVSAILIAIQGGPIGMHPKLAAVVDGLVPARLRKSAPVADPVADQEVLDAVRAVTGHEHGAGIEVRELTVRFGGVSAVEAVSLHAPMGKITGLIGPNGAGKTTMFNACSGLNRPATGTVSLNGRSLSGTSPAARARAGLGRTFQIMELAGSLTVFENVALGREAGQAATNPLTQAFSRPRERRIVEAATREALNLCGISHLADRQAGELSTGERRLVELARCLAGPFDLLLLDEPSSGLDRSETAEFGDVLRRVVADRGCGILLVEHDMGLVMNVCDYIYVLDFGNLIFEGTAPETVASSVVQRAYLGDQDVAPVSEQSVERETEDIS